MLQVACNPPLNRTCSVQALPRAHPAIGHSVTAQSAAFHRLTQLPTSVAALLQVRRVLKGARCDIDTPPAARHLRIAARLKRCMCQSWQRPSFEDLRWAWRRWQSLYSECLRASPCANRGSAATPHKLALLPHEAVTAALKAGQQVLDRLTNCASPSP
jgi:hypothetical protein